MKKITLVTGLVFAVVLPVAAVAKPSPDRGDKRAAQAECKALRGQTTATHEAFRALQKSFVACVKAKSSEEAQEEQNAHSNAAKECKAEGVKGREFGKCVSEKAKAKEHAADEQDQEDAAEQKNAAKECATERTADADAFREKYGTNANKRNAFGKCVSQKVREDDTE
ncbi:MAG: hypothetical protein ACJ76M_12305 [Solirubrobacteraceae bacterium]